MEKADIKKFKYCCFCNTQNMSSSISDYGMAQTPLSASDTAMQRKQLHLDETDSGAAVSSSSQLIGSTAHTATTVSSPLLLPPTNEILNILPGTPADAAIQAQAHVRVTKVKKLARYLHVQSVGRVVRHGLLMLPSSGNKKGKPPRIPPNLLSVDTSLPEQQQQQQQEPVLELSNSEVYENDHFDEASWDLEDEALESVVDTKDAVDEEGVEADSTPPPPPPPLISPTLSRASSSRLSPLKWPSVLAPSSSPRHSMHKIPTFYGETAQEKRQRRRQERKEKRLLKKNTRKSYVKGKVIDREHELYTLSIAMMLGLRTSIGVTHAQLAEQQKEQNQPWLNPEDFMQVEKYQFKPSGSSQTPPHQLSHTFKVKAYSPMVFAYIRRLFGINESEFLLSVCGRASYIEFISNAKSGQFFFYSNDGKYMIKTMTNAESKFLRRILPHYFQHCVQNPNTLITKFLGMYRVKMYHLQRTVKFIIMNSVFDTDKVLQSFFDLKGSALGRDAKPGQSVKKDNDVRRALPDSVFSLLPPVRERMRHQLVQDLDFLKRMKIMDYSMLIGVHHIPFHHPSSTVHEDTLHGSMNARATAVMGLNFRDQTTRVMQRAQVDHQKSKQGSHLIVDASPTAANDGVEANIVDADKSNVESIPVEEISPTAVLHRATTDHRNLLGSTPSYRSYPARKESTSLDGREDPLDPPARKSSEAKLTLDESTSKLQCESPCDTFYSASSKQDETKSKQPIYRNDIKDKGAIENQHTDENLIRTILGAQSYASYSTLDEYSSDSDDDENSLLEVEKFDQTRRKDDGSGSVNDENIGIIPCNDSLDILKERMTEELYWPFHYLYNVKGRRRLRPGLVSPAPNISQANATHEPEPVLENIKKRSLKPWSQRILGRYNTCLAFHDQDVELELSSPTFTPPLSNRKDGGFVMDTSGFNLPLKVNMGVSTQYLDGKIFYMGIIDILQQFNVRKRLEARFRRIKGGGWEGASCVHPFVYADRFVRFFDEYTATREAHFRNDGNL